MLLTPVALVFGALSTARRFFFKLGWLKTTKLPLPVLVVGNRIVGGAGKTPTSIAIIEHLKAKGWTPGVLTRGYKAKSSGHPRPLLLDASSQQVLTASDCGDEPWLIWRRTQVPIVIDPIRVRGGQAMIQQHPEVDILVCDDGLQHWALSRDLEIVVFDERGQGNGWLLPAGPLREPIETESISDLVTAPIVLYNAPHPSTRLPGYCVQKSTAPLVSLSDWWQGGANPGKPLTPQQAGNQQVWALAGIAQPHRFFDQLRAMGWQVHGHPLADHADLSTLLWPHDVSHVIVTEKDAVKLRPEHVRSQRPHTSVWVASLNFNPEPGFWDALDKGLSLLPQPGSTSL